MRIMSQAVGASLEKCRYTSQRNTVSQRNVLRFAETDFKLDLLDTPPPQVGLAGLGWTCRVASIKNGKVWLAEGVLLRLVLMTPRNSSGVPFISEASVIEQETSFIEEVLQYVVFERGRAGGQ
ncbi:hypothetical protein E2C01_028179 [Portunus trituberculatus]|uniref:Uncharacterized protein n=1 Tax=Portunus trituberculatus TaxID=210409 RepID=A0A5B7EN72_PORTR|nr:hypothetical protein [Portunus trituberculatus]